MTARPGRVRLARLTDLAALGELSRLSHRAHQEGDIAVRSLGLPVQASHVSVFSLFRMPLGAFQPNDPLYVYDQEGRLAGLARADREASHDHVTVDRGSVLEELARGAFLVTDQHRVRLAEVGVCASQGLVECGLELLVVGGQRGVGDLDARRGGVGACAQGCRAGRALLRLRALQ